MEQDAIIFTLDCEIATRQLGSDLALYAEKGDVFALSGALGTGKTTLARAFIRYNAENPELEVPSPTFTLVQFYDGRCPVAHFDLYRITQLDELAELGLEDATQDTLCLIEWPERVQEFFPRFFPQDIISVSLNITEEQNRQVMIGGIGERFERIKRSLMARNFITHHCGLATVRTHRYGDASTRLYESIKTADNTMIMMNMVPKINGPITKDGRNYNRIAHRAETMIPFIAVDQLLRERGFNAPKLLARDLENGFLIMEDLGAGSLFDDKGKPIHERYLSAISVLAKMHDMQWPRTVTIANSQSISHHILDYDETAMLVEVELLLDWFVEYKTGRPENNSMRHSFLEIWREYILQLQNYEQSLVLRDYHAPNLIWCNHQSAYTRIGLLDFQDALFGPSAYDVASLAQDARVSVDEVLEEKLLQTYVNLRQKKKKDFDADQFYRIYPIVSAQRITKILGIFVRLYKNDRKVQYLKHIERVLHYLDRNFTQSVLHDYKDWFRKYLEKTSA